MEYGQPINYHNPENNWHFSSPSSYQLPIDPHLRVGLCEPLPHPKSGILVGLILCRPCECSCRHCEFMWVEVCLVLKGCFTVTLH